ncbi:hypothetical protein VOLCADRAFT_106005 [Volvox carteri f. nagariensis]|uniref:Uncharacterized protein n=1 Tax=Volvox carteri f. nagariensis TaxID=3068 RepID=D8U478_VOLCA|nr:uncharacterized protein VOLCADRAFT_106005 [Volvox carteri f. nagariensis]EFJ45542.1 hypothetical protein VOLCADRAFT_106005 [Volvox carteri f. nagariensis]|eukprot:XP_002953569.1 hypothetical protein VOLCADRAFT_106005 [Volvox carteri f. nagariensis]
MYNEIARSQAARWLSAAPTSLLGLPLHRSRPRRSSRARPRRVLQLRRLIVRLYSSPIVDLQEWSALVCNCDFFFNDPQNESVAEQLRERVRFFKEQNRDIDFYIVPEPVWLDKKFPELAKQVKRPCVALISTDKTWITFMKLRLDRVLRIDLKDMPDSEVLAVGGEVPEFKPVGKWTAPYARYTPGWWKVFEPKH